MINQDEQLFSAGNFLNGVIEDVESNLATIRTEDEQKILWPLNKLPAGISLNAPVKLFITTKELAEADRQKLAQAVLKEILNTDD
ncbi:MAG: hypothetical protein WC518_04145 [Patescibacteria group bacterium]